MSSESLFQAAEEKNVSESLIREKLATLPDIKKEVHVWEKKYQVDSYLYSLYICKTFLSLNIDISLTIIVY